MRLWAVSTATMDRNSLKNAFSMLKTSIVMLVLRPENPDGTLDAEYSFVSTPCIKRKRRSSWNVVAGSPAK